MELNESHVNQEPVVGDVKDDLDILPADIELVTKINNWDAETKDFYSTLANIQYSRGREIIIFVCVAVFLHLL